MVSTVAGTDVSGYVGVKDIVMVPSIVDVSGVNRISREVFAKAAAVDPEGFDAWANLAAGYEEVGRYHDAALAYERTLELHPAGAGARVIQERLERIVGLLDNCKIPERGERE